MSMDLLQKLWHGLGTRDKLLVASASLVSGFVVSQAIAQKRARVCNKGTEETKAPQPQDMATLAAALGLKPTFSRRLVELAEFKGRVGHADVPLDSASGSGLVPRGLGKWVYTQRKRKADGVLDAAEEAALTSLGFRWTLDPDELDPDEMIERLVAYKERAGNTLVPKKYETDPLLGAWVASVRRKSDPLLNGGKSVLEEDLREKLDKVGFSWEPEKRCGSAFMTGFRAWSEAKMQGKPVPEERWCQCQRMAKAQGRLSEQRISYLDKFGFDWDLGAHA
jgi:hypothetical protein